MRLRALPALLLCVLTAPLGLAAQGRTVSIAGRQDCDPSLYEDLPVSLTAITDTATLYAALQPYRRSLESVWITLDYATTGALQGADFVADKRSNAERAQIAAKLSPLFRPIPSGLRAAHIAVVLDSGMTSGAYLRPVDLTCLPALIKPDAVLRTWQDAIRALRKSRALHQQASGAVVIRFTVSEEGTLLSPVIQQSSGNPAVDSTAMAVMSRAAFLPAVAGRTAVALLSSQALRF